MEQTKTREDHSEPIEHDMGSSIDRPSQTPDRTEKAVIGAFAHQVALITWFLGPMFIYMVSNDHFVKKHASEAFNWQINITFFAFFTLLMTPATIGVVMFVLLYIVNIVLCVIGSIKAINNDYWDYPLSPNYLD